MNAPSGSLAPLPRHVLWLVCIIASIGFAFDTYELLMLPLVAGPAIAEILQVPPSNPLVTQWVGNLLWITALCGGVFGLLGGWLTDRLGRKTVLAGSIFLYSFSPVLAAFSTSLPWFLFFRCATFVGVCIEFVAAITWLAELFPEKQLWPQDRLARARARSICAEMHSGFVGLRSACPMNIEAHLPEVGALALRDKPAVRADLQRIVSMWSNLLAEHGGPMLLGHFTIADAFFAPVVMRLKTYALPVPTQVATYMDRVCALPGVKAWIDEGVRPAFGRQEVVELRIAASYICRPRNNIRGAKISEHGRGKAIDISGFILSNGRELSVSDDYNRQMRRAHRAACGIFGTTLGPGSDGYHEDHLHFDTASHGNGPYCR